MHDRGSVPKGLALVGVSSLSFALMAAGAKQVATVLTFWETTFWRSVITVLIATLVLARRPKAEGGGSRWLWLRGLVGTIGLVCYFFALSRIPLANAMMLNNTAPIFTVLLAALFLGERLTLSRILSLSLALAGVWLILRPAEGTVAIGTWIGLVSGLFAGIVHVIIKHVSLRHDPWELVWHFAAVAVFVTLPGTVADFHLPTGALAGLVVLTGLFATLAQVAMTTAYRHLAASAASTSGLLSVLAAVLVGWAAFGEVPTLATLGGGTLLVAGIIGINLPEILAKRRAEATTPVPESIR